MLRSRVDVQDSGASIVFQLPLFKQFSSTVWLVLNLNETEAKGCNKETPVTVSWPLTCLVLFSVLCSQLNKVHTRIKTARFPLLVGGGKGPHTGISARSALFLFNSKMLPDIWHFTTTGSPGDFLIGFYCESLEEPP